MAPGWILLLLGAQDAAGSSHEDVSPACPLPSSEGFQVVPVLNMVFPHSCSQDSALRDICFTTPGNWAGRCLLVLSEADGTCCGGKLGCGTGGSPPLHPQEGKDQPVCPWQGRAQECFPPLQVPAAELLPGRGRQGTAPARPGLFLNSKPQALLRR